jgi:KDO2-lipid IV(A) lauroyltransferase
MKLPRWMLPARNAAIRQFTRLAFLVVKVLPERSAYAFGAWVGRIAYRLQPNWRRTALRNLELLYRFQPAWAKPGRAEMERMAAQSAVNLGWEAVEFIRMGQQPVEVGLGMVTEELGGDHLRAMLSRGKGAIAVGLHFGNWEIAAAYISNRIGPLYAVGKAQRDDYFTRIAFGWRERYGVHNIFAGKRANSDILRALRSGSILGLVSDQNGGNEGIFAPFCGTMASNTPGAAALALKTGAPLCVVFCQRLGPGRHRFVATREISLDGLSEEPQARLVEAVTRINTALEKVILTDPSQWLLGHKRWRTRPPGDPPLY